MASTLSGLSNLNWSPQGLMGSFQSMGAKATSPATNVTPPSSTLPKGQNMTPLPTGGAYSASPTTSSTSGLFGSPTTAQMAANRAATVAGSNGMLKEVNGQVVSASQPATSNGGSSTSQPTPPATPTVTTPPNVYTQSTKNLSNTQPTTGTTNAIDTSQGIANNQGTNAPAGTPGAYANTATTGLLGMSQNQTPAVVQAEQNVADFNATNPLMKAQQSALPMAAEISSGRGQILGNTLANTSQGLANTLNAAIQGEGQQITAGNEAGSLANTTQGQQLTGANQAGSLANTAQSNQIEAQYNAGSLTSPANTTAQVPYNNQLLNLQNGQPVGGGTAGQLPPDAQVAVNSYAQQVKSGSMTRQDAESRLSAYGVAGTNALNAILGPNFNTNASNASAQTTATGQAIQTAATATNSALDTLGSLFENLSILQTGGIPLTDSIANWFFNKMGQTGLTQYQTALSDARSQLIGVLNASGGTPTGNEATAMQYLPDNMTAGQFQQLVGTAQNPGTARQLVQQKVSAFTNSGTQNSSTSPGSSGVQYNSDGSLKAVSF